MRGLAKRCRKGVKGNSLGGGWTGGREFRLFSSFGRKRRVGEGGGKDTESNSSAGGINEENVGGKPGRKKSRTTLEGPEKKKGKIVGEKILYTVAARRGMELRKRGSSTIEPCSQSDTYNAVP